MWFVILTSLVSVALLAIIFVRKRYAFWKCRNVPFLEPIFPYGNFKSQLKQSLAETSLELYNLMDQRERFYGLFVCVEPIVMITDLELIRTVLISDFSYFPDHGMYHNEKDDPLSAHLFSIEGEKWRSMRAKLSPCFTPGRTKAALPILRTVASNFAKYTQKLIGDGLEVDVKKLFVQFTIENISNYGFGIECNNFENPDNLFQLYGQKGVDTPRHPQLVQLLLGIFPSVGRALGVKMFQDDVIDFFKKLMNETIEKRLKGNNDREDFIKLLLEMKATNPDVTMNDLYAQAFLFFVAGYETTSSTLSFCLYEMAMHPEIQERARTNVLSALEQHGGLTHEALADMSYVTWCFYESLRKYPALPVLPRQVGKDYRVPGTDTVLPKGMKVMIPTYAIQNDERYFPEPARFNPERFAPENEANRHVSTFLSFGEGPRMCLAKRFGTMQAVVGLATALANFRFSIGPKTVIPVRYSIDTLPLQPRGAVWLHAEPWQR